MALCVGDYDEMNYLDPNKTWEWIEEKGHFCFERQRQRDNHIYTLSILNGAAAEPAEWIEMAVPGVEGNDKGAASFGNGDREKVRVSLRRTVATLNSG